MRIRILSIVGSTRAESRTYSLLHLMQLALEGRGVANPMWSLREQPLPMMDADLRGEVQDIAVRQFVAECGAADGFILGTPVYHGSYSGVLKNALDHLDSSCLEHKPFALVSHGGRQSTQPAADLANVVRSCRGIAIPGAIATDDSHLTFDERGRVVAVRDASVAERIAALCDSLIDHAATGYALRSARLRRA